MEKWVDTSKEFLIQYIKSFQNLNAEHAKNFDIKKEHSFRVAEISKELAMKQNLNEQEISLAFLIGILHDIGRFKQLVEYNTFNDAKSVNHAELGISVLKENNVLEKLHCEFESEVFTAIENHNRFGIEKGLSENEIKFAKLLRDADKLDILKVLSDYYSNKNAEPNHTLTWELPKSNKVNEKVYHDILANKLVEKKVVLSETDVKIMQLSWVFDFNFKASYEYLLKNRYLEKIYNSLPKNDKVIEIYRKVKVFVENKLFM